MGTLGQILAQIGTWAGELLLAYPSILLYGALALLVLGIVLGVSGRITVFRDFNDFGLVFLIPVIPLAVIFTLVNLGAEDIPPAAWSFIGILEALLVGFIAVTTWVDNRNPLAWFLAMYTKLPLGVLYAWALLEAMAPDRRHNVRQRRKLVIAIILFLTPLIFALVREKRGVLIPERAIARYARP